MGSSVILKEEGSVARIVLNRPEKLNAIDSQMMGELTSTLRRVAQDDNVLVVVLTGAGRAFCAGADLSPSAEFVHDRHPHPEQFRRFGIPYWQESQDLLYKMEKPTIAMVNGPAVGAGCLLALSCDMRIGCENSGFHQGFARIGSGAKGDAWLLARVVGYARAAELIFLDKVVRGQEAKDMGLLNSLLPAEKLEEETLAMAQRIATYPPTGLRLAKLALRVSLAMSYGDGMEFCNLVSVLGNMAEDHHEAAAAFREKRAPRFKGY